MRWFNINAFLHHIPDQTGTMKIAMVNHSHPRFMDVVVLTERRRTCEKFSGEKLLGTKPSTLQWNHNNITPNNSGVMHVKELWSP